MPRFRGRLHDVAAAKLQPWLQRLTGAALAVLVLGLTALTPGEAAQASVQTSDPVSARGVASQVGQPAPELTVTTLDGLSLTSADLQAQEKPYILYFFASW
jgi:hypothetical protein